MFTVKEKKEFMGSIIEITKKELFQNADRFPDNWNGVEMRQLLADKFSAICIKMDRKRKQNYDNDVLIHNLL